MSSWWDIGWPLAALACLAIGLYCGYKVGQDRAADAETEARFAAVPDPGRHRVSSPRMLPAAPKAASDSTAALFARLEAEASPPTAPLRRLPLQVAEVPIMAPGPRLGELVRPAREHRPGRATDFIKAMERDTDRFIAAIGGER